MEKTYCNLGHAYDNPLGSYPQTYSAGGQELIHELTHAWQIAHSDFLPGLMCSGIVNQANYLFGDNVYAYGQAGPDWSSFNLEQQGAIVNQWFGGNGTTVLSQWIRQTPTTAMSGTIYCMGKNASLVQRGICTL